MRTNSYGAGDTVERIFKNLGINKVMKKITKGKGCSGCQKRKEQLNKFFSK